VPRGFKFFNGRLFRETRSIPRAVPAHVPHRRDCILGTVRRGLRSGACLRRITCSTPRLVRVIFAAPTGHLRTSGIQQPYRHCNAGGRLALPVQTPCVGDRISVIARTPSQQTGNGNLRRSERGRKCRQPYRQLCSCTCLLVSSSYVSLFALERPTRSWWTTCAYIFAAVCQSSIKRYFSSQTMNNRIDTALTALGHLPMRRRSHQT